MCNRSLIATFIIAGNICGQAPAPGTAKPQGFGGSYESLKPKQQELLRDWIARFEKTTGTKIDPVKAWSNARLSDRTTYDAVTHALLNANLTDESGKPLGAALDLVDSLEEVAGEVKGAGGDIQFRIYVYLKPNAIDLLEGSSEFARARDNTSYHKGYPICYRLMGAAPTIQISIARDSKRADIDVDYRSSKFPQMIVNGHLQAANSDVRAGDNDQRHNQRWSGLTDWWRQFFGMEMVHATPWDRRATDNPRMTKKQDLDEAVHDLLTTWLVAGEAANATSYFSHRTIPCVEIALARSGKTLDAGMAPYILARTLHQFVERRGQAAAVSDRTIPVPPWDERLRPHDNKFDKEFQLFEVPDDIAATHECSERYVPTPQPGKVKSKYGEYFGSAFRMKSSDQELGGVTYLLWTKEDGYWRVVGFDTAAEPLPALAAAPKERVQAESKPAQQERVEGDPDAVRAIDNFLQEWFVRRRYEAATAVMTPAAEACALEVTDGLHGKPASAIHESVVASMRNVSEAMKGKKRLRDMIEAAAIEHEEVKLVNHPNQDVYTVAKPSASLAHHFLCENRGKKARSSPTPVAGDFYACAFRLRSNKTDAAVLYTLWAKNESTWKMIAWDVETH